MMFVTVVIAIESQRKAPKSEDVRDGSSQRVGSTAMSANGRAEQGAHFHASFAQEYLIHECTAHCSCTWVGGEDVASNEPLTICPPPPGTLSLARSLWKYMNIKRGHHLSCR